MHMHSQVKTSGVNVDLLAIVSLFCAEWDVQNQVQYHREVLKRIPYSACQDEESLSQGY